MSSWIGFVKDGQYEHPIKAGPVPRRVNTGYQTWTRRFQSLLLAGLVPFLVAFIELTIAFNSMWQEKTSFYYMYGFLAVVCVVLVITVMETSIVAIYLQLCHEVSSTASSLNQLKAACPDPNLILGLSLVVAQLFGRCIVFALDLCVLRLVFRCPTACPWFYIEPPLFQLQSSRLRPIRFNSGHHRLLDCLRICTTDI